jgi:hypothetical protein
VRRLAHRRAEDLAVTERPTRDLATQFGVLLVALWVGFLVVENERSNHR